MEFCKLVRHNSALNSEDNNLPKTSLPEYEFSFDDSKLNLLFSHNLRNYKKDDDKLGINGIKKIINQVYQPNSFLIPYLFRNKLVDNGYSFPTSDFSFMLFRTNDIIVGDDNRKLFTFKSVLTNTSHIRKECEKFVLQQTLNDELAFKIELVIAELLSNVIVHGLKNKPDTMVVLSLEISDRITLNVWDKGIEWTPPEISKDNAFASVDNDATSGRGMPIIITLSNSIDRCRIDRINQTIINFNLDPEKE